ncbi:MAG: protein-glutamate O-methyltransferase CheR [Campylobacterales bacterium]|nr:protein-glutamate O-methyltransferase CheR [Campylobacterales bacterium]
MNDFSKDNFEKLSEYIYRKSGIKLEYDKHYDKVNKKITSRCQILHFDSFRKYFFKIRFEDKDSSEFQELINSITVNETYFFRENHQFEIMVKYLMPIIDKEKRKGEPIRILSAPCSTGEEPYSIAIYLLEDDTIINNRDIEIVGIDIDSVVIEKAKKGLYTDRSLHAVPKDIQTKYFKKTMGYNELSRDLRDAIVFLKSNVFDKDNMRELGKFDIIFSRNMLIYFDDESRKEVAMTFYDMLNPKGYIMLGHAEYMSRIVSVFHPLKYDNHLIYQK